MVVIRYIVTLGVYGTIILAGALIASFSCITMFEMGTRAAGYFAGGGQVTESSSITFLIQFFGFWSLLAVTGGLLFWVGGRAALRRIRAGLPGANEGVGRSLAARAGLGMLFGLAFLWGASGFVLAIVTSADFALLGFTGTTTEAKLTGFRSTDNPRRWTVMYEFEVAGGTFTGTTLAWSRNPDPPPLKTLPVTYEAGNPARNDVFAPEWLADLAFYLVSRGLAALVGLWGIMRNIAPGKGPEAAPLVDEPLRSRAPMPPPRRASFGRRGA